MVYTLVLFILIKSIGTNFQIGIEMGTMRTFHSILGLIIFEFLHLTRSLDQDKKDATAKIGHAICFNIRIAHDHKNKKTSARRMLFPIAY